MSSGGEDETLAGIDKSPSNASSRLAGWSAIEDYMRRHDHNMMKVFVEDMDTLLVFAGLFSAVLTAFVVESYQLLQVDNIERSAQLLSKISSQLGSFENAPPFLNSTTSSESLSSSFNPSTSARWINILWFLSLVFSLASALFAILVKQWIREFLQWDSTLAPPRENVLVRQLRFEAWNVWRVPAGISAIPALLEVAVVLFVLGLVVLSWTLDAVVAVVVTIAAAILLLVVCAVTILTAVFQHCPYKSSTGWACVIVFDAFVRFIRYTSWLFARFWLYIRTSCYRLDGMDQNAQNKSIPQFLRFQGWRQRDLHIDGLGSRGDLLVADVGVSDLDSETGYVNHRHLMQNIFEVMPLVRALTWVKKASKDARLLSHVARSAECLHRDGLNIRERYYTVLYMLRKLCTAKSEKLKPLSDFLDGLRSTAYRTVKELALEEDAFLFRGGVPHHLNDHLQLSVHPVEEYATQLWVLAHYLLGDTLTSVWAELKDPTITREVVVLLCLLRDFTAADVWRNTSFGFLEECRTRLVKLHGDVALCSPIKRSGIPTMIMEILCGIGGVRVTHDERPISVSASCGSPSTYVEEEVAMNALWIFEQNVDYSDQEASHRFVMMADLLLRSLNRWPEYLLDSHLLSLLLQRMSDAVRLSLQKGYWNCGCYHDLPWIDSLLSCDDTRLRGLPSQPFWSLLDALEESLAGRHQPQSLISGEQADENFARLKRRVEQSNPRPSCSGEYPGDQAEAAYAESNSASIGLGTGHPFAWGEICE